MTSIKKIYYLIIFSLLFTVYSQSQEIIVDTIITKSTRKLVLVTVHTVPKFILQIDGNLNYGALELSAHNGGFLNLDFMSGKNFGARNGLGGNLTFKIPLSKKGKFWFDVTAGYNRFQSDLFTDNTFYGKAGYNQFFGGLGAEYNFTPSHRVKYYTGVSTLFSIIDGKAQLANADSINRTYYDVKINPGFRIGYSIFMGMNISLSKDIGLNLGMKFSHANLLLKETIEPKSPYETELNDDATDPRKLYSGWKQFAYITMHTGISYYFGVKERRYKLE
jgi:hypothetical protein